MKRVVVILQPKQALNPEMAKKIKVLLSKEITAALWVVFKMNKGDGDSTRFKHDLAYDDVLGRMQDYEMEIMLNGNAAIVPCHQQAADKVEEVFKTFMEKEFPEETYSFIAVCGENKSEHISLGSRTTWKAEDKSAASR